MRMNYMGITPSQMSLFLLSKDMLYNRHFKTTRVVHQEAGKTVSFNTFQVPSLNLSLFLENRVFKTLTYIATCAVTL